MSSIILPENCHILRMAKDVVQICEPLSQLYNITNFYYARIYDDGSFYGFITNIEYVKYHCQKQYLISPPIPEKIIQDKFFFIGTPEATKQYNQVYYEACSLFNIDYPIHMIERYDNYYDIFTYSSTPNNPNILSFYINNINILENFKFYFKEKAAALIKKANKNRIILPLNMRPTFGGLKKIPSMSKSSNKVFDEQLKIKHYKFIHDGKEISFTKKQLEALKLFVHGNTIKETAKILMLSPRTVEHYLDNIRNKIGIKKKAEILKLCSKYNILDIV